MANRGAPSKYKKINLHQVEKLAGFGLIDLEIANVLGISRATLSNYKKNPEFLEALKVGKDKADAKVLASLFKRAIGFEHADLFITQYKGDIVKEKIRKYFPPDTLAQIYWLNNRRKHDWRNKPEDNSGDMPFNVDFDNMSDEELEKYVNKE